MKKFLICLIVLVLFGCTKNTETQGEIKQKPVEDKHITEYYNDINYSGKLSKNCLNFH